ncbi:MAG: class I SAM-dependent methyltransferase [Deltaproteobacteria bacterium]|nr:class I SAM-dependent methyltransferase [Deltaproteobacteria bacterium]
MRRKLRGLAGIVDRRGPGTPYRAYESLRFWATRDREAAVRFLTAPSALSLDERVGLLLRFTRITNALRGYHTQAEMLTISSAILRHAMRPELAVVEAGVAHGSSTAKLSWVTARAGGKLVAFDSFRGIPKNDEVHQNLDGRTVVFRQGAFSGRIGAVKRALETYGAPGHVELVKGLLEDTLSRLTGHVDVAILDLDLLSSTRTAVKAIFPKIRSGGSLFTQDGHLRAVAELLGSEAFWREEVGVVPRPIEGLGTKKLLEIRPR